MIKQLAVILWPDGLYELDWSKSGDSGSGDEKAEELLRLETEIYDKYKKDREEAFFFLGLVGQAPGLSNSLQYLRSLSSAFVRKIARLENIEALRERAEASLSTEEVSSFLQNAPYMLGLEHLNEDWVSAAWERLNRQFRNKISVYDGSVESFLSSFRSDINVAGRVCFHLVENKNGEYPFAFMATYLDEAALRHLPLKNALKEYGEDKGKLLHLLASVNRASENSRLIGSLVSSGELFYPIALSSNEAYTFLKEAPMYEDAGVLCRIPDWWKRRYNSVKVSVTVGEKKPSQVGADALLSFNAALSLGDEEITEEELRQLASQEAGLVLLKGKWVEADHEKLAQALRAYEEIKQLGDMDIISAMRLQLGGGLAGLSAEAAEERLEVSNGKWLEQLVSKLRSPAGIRDISLGDDFRAKLRIYQQTGLKWMDQMKSLGLGACLADDMGLGKTVQVIALLNHIRAQGKPKTLLVIPASLIGNWTSELQRFAPNISYMVLHTSENKFDYQDDSLLDGHELFITTYAMLSKLEWLRDVTWDCLILDEAQAIKNSGSNQTRNVKKLNAKFRLALTGTPIENRVSDLWSLFDFLNKGLLGSSKEFGRFAKELSENNQGYSRLKQVVSPFILRRLKTDKSIIKDLPEKIEMKTYSSLTKKQAALYEALVRDIEYKLSNAEGIERKGLIISSIMKFKQICNHPDQYSGQAGYAEKHSGKFALLRELCETIYEKRERVLVFTQFREIAEPLKNFLEGIFEREGLMLHGGVSIAKRKDIVDRFQGEEYVPFMVLSVKAGGVGLNLTAASHVIHFDRWWNPAVENQATDRAFRIGQMKNVLVHKIITKGTIEEKIDAMLEDKTALSGEIIGDMQEAWITEMDNESLMNIFRLSNK